MSTAEHKELVDLATRIHAWQQSRSKNNSQMIRDFPGLGSDKTYAYIRDDKLEGFDVESQLVNYRSVWALIEALDGASTAEDPIFDDLGTVQQLRRAALEVMKETGTARVVIVQGIPGVGKSTAVRILCGKYGVRCIAVEACDVWKDSAGAMLGAIIKAISHTESLPPFPVDRLERVQELLCRSRRCVLIDEAHHLGPHCLNTIKTLVNTTPGEFILLAIPTLWNRLESNAYQEARQISTNRLSERVKLDLTESDISRYLRSFFSGLPDDVSRAAARTIRPAAVGMGAMLFVRDVCREARRQAGDALPDARIFSDAVTASTRKR